MNRRIIYQNLSFSIVYQTWCKTFDIGQTPARQLSSIANLLN